LENEKDVKRLLHLYSTEAEQKEIEQAIDKAQLTESGKVRQGDVVRKVMLNWARNGGKI
jgi:hypothetical protein